MSDQVYRITKSRIIIEGSKNIKEYFELKAIKQEAKLCLPEEPEKFIERVCTILGIENDTE